MKRSSSTFFLIAAILVSFLAASSVHFQLYKKYKSENNFFSSMLYLPPSKYLKPLSFGYRALLADFLYLWSIQYYGDPVFQSRTEYLKRTFDQITELDPHYMDAYQVGALFMFHDGRNPMEGLQLLEQGMKKNPNEWILPMEAGFYCYMTMKRNDLAARYFERAAKIPGAVSLAKRAQASMTFKMGDKFRALALWTEVYQQADTPTIKQTAYQHIHDLRVLIDVEMLRKAITIFYTKFMKPPLNLDQLVSQGLLKQVPVDPDGNPYSYDPRSGYVKYSSQLPLYKRYQ